MADGRVNPTLITLVVIAIIAAGAGGMYVLNQNKDQVATTPDTNASVDNQPENTSGETTITTYTDGTYKATGNYSTPGGTESVTVSLTLNNGAISDITTTGSATGGNSAQFQGQFLANYKSQVVGKSIDKVRLSKVAGSSLTSSGFNRALDTIKNDAQS